MAVADEPSGGHVSVGVGGCAAWLSRLAQLGVSGATWREASTRSFTPITQLV